MSCTSIQENIVTPSHPYYTPQNVVSQFKVETFTAPYIHEYLFIPHESGAEIISSYDHNALPQNTSGYLALKKGKKITKANLPLTDIPGYVLGQDISVYTLQVLEDTLGIYNNYTDKYFIEHNAKIPVSYLFFTRELPHPYMDNRSVTAFIMKPFYFKGNKGDVLTFGKVMQKHEILMFIKETVTNNGIICKEFILDHPSLVNKLQQYTAHCSNTGLTKLIQMINDKRSIELTLQHQYYSQ